MFNIPQPCILSDIISDDIIASKKGNHTFSDTLRADIYRAGFLAC